MSKRIFVYFLMLSMMLTLTGCSSKDSSKSGSSANEASTIPEGKSKATTSGNNIKDSKAENASDVKTISSAADTGAFNGYYKLEKFIIDGEDITASLEELQEMGSGIYMIIDENGTGIYNMLGEITKFDWNDKNFIMHDEEDGDTNLEYTFADGVIELTDDSSKMVFTKMTEDEIKSYENGESNKTVDQITDDIIDSAYDDAMQQIDSAAEEANESISDAANEASDSINGSLNALGDAKEDDKPSISGSLQGSASGKSKENETPKLDSSYLPDLSASKHNDAGYYDIMAFQESGTTYSKSQLKNAGVEFDMMLCPDGTGYGHFIGTYYDLSWDDGTIYVATDEGQEKMIYFKSDYDGKQIITISDSDMAMVFEYIGEPDATYEWTGNSGLKPN